MKKTTFSILATTIALATLAACGGGGGSAGEPAKVTNPNKPSSPTKPNDTTAKPAAKIDVNTLNKDGTPSVRLGATETGSIRATVTNAEGAPVPDKLVTFAEEGGGLIEFSPASGSVLTDTSGIATIEFKAKAADANGATTIKVSTKLSDDETPTGTKEIQFTANPSPVNIDPKTLVRSIELADVNPSDKSIVIKGASASGRSETAQVRFRLLDKNGSPVKGATVSFGQNPPDAVDLNILTAKSDTDGYVSTTVTSKQKPTSVVITAAVSGTQYKGQSDQLTVTTGFATKAGFEVNAKKYNLDGRYTGDKTTVTARLRDKNGNPVADNLAVVFTTDFGVIGSSSRGGCTTQNGECTVDFKVQNPRGQGLATVIAAVETGKPGATTLSKTIRINMSAAASKPVSLPSAIIMNGVCELRKEVTLSDGNNRALAAETALSTFSSAPKLTAEISRGSPVEDSLSLKPTKATLDFKLDESVCDPDPNNNTKPKTATVTIDAKTPNGINHAIPLKVTYKVK